MTEERFYEILREEGYPDDLIEYIYADKYIYAHKKDRVLDEGAVRMAAKMTKEFMIDAFKNFKDLN